MSEDAPKYKTILDDVTIVIDSREKKPLQFPEGVKTKVKGLKTGDYSIEDYEEVICFEAKDIRDLIGTCSHQNRDRFRRELQRMADFFQCYAIVISGEESDILPACQKIYSTQMRQHVAKVKKGFKGRKPMRPEVRAKGVIGTLKALRVDYNCHHYFLGDKKRTAEWIVEQCTYFMRHKN